MNHFEEFIPIVIGGGLAWFVFLGIRELLKETSIAINKRSAA